LALAVTDSYYNFFIVCALAASLGLVRAKRTSPFVVFSALTGLSAGLACSVKITGLPLIALYYGMLLIPIGIVRGVNWRAVVYGPMAGLLAALVTVYTLNPFFWPFETPRMLLEFPNLYLRTREAFGEVAANTWGTPPDRWGVIHARLFGATFRSIPGETVAFAIGLGWCVWRLVSGLRARRMDPWGAAAVYFAVHYVFIVALIQFDFVRYYVPAAIAMKLVAAIGMAAPVYWLWGRFAAKSSGQDGSTAEPGDDGARV
jgi:hypothetical protein